MWNDMQIQYSDAIDIAEALFNKEVTLSQLTSSPTFTQAKADLVEDALWAICNNRMAVQQYLDFYPHGKHKAEVEENIWKTAVSRNDMGSFLDYQNRYPQGVHANEVDDKVWDIAKANKTIPAYLNFFPNGKHADEARMQQDTMQRDEEAWAEAQGFGTTEAYRRYTERFPNGLYVEEANQRIRDILIGQKENILRALSEDRNAYPLNYIKNVLGITKEDLLDRIKDSQGRIRNEVLNSWDKNPINLLMGKTPKCIPAGSTEVYFWGVPGSGKTCAMAAILSQARQMGCFAPRRGEGLAYMNALSSMFMAEPTRPAVCLPPGSDVDTTQYLPLTLNERIKGRNGQEEIRQHNLSVIEISGEIFECFSNEVEGRPFPTQQHEETYEQLKKYLRSNDNPKFHFFILDSKPLRDTNQMQFLQNAALYFQEEGIFNNTTQGISLIVTKSDVLSPDRSQWVECAKDAATRYFNSLVTQLKVIVGNPKAGGLGLTDGSLEVIPLSIGEVFFQSLCLFDPEPATVLVQKLIAYSKVAETNDWKRKTKWFFNS